MARFPWETEDSVFPEVRETESGRSGATGLMPWEMPASAPYKGPDESALAPREFERRHPSRATRIGAGIRYSLQGMPIFGNLVSRTEASRDFGRTYPTVGGAGRLVSGIGPYGAASRAVQAGATGARNVLARLFGSTNPPRTSPGLFLDTGTQAGLGAGTALADRQMSDRPFRSTDEMFLTGGIGAAGGAFGPLMSRTFAPSGVGRRISAYDAMRNPPSSEFLDAVARIPASEYARIHAISNHDLYLRELNRALNRERGRGLAETTSRHVTRFGPALLGGAIGYHAGGGPLGAMYGIASGEAIRGIMRGITRTPGGQRWLGNQITPEMAALLNSVGPSFTLDQLRD